MATQNSSPVKDSKTMPVTRPIHKKAAAAAENHKPMHVKGWIRSMSSHSASFIAVSVTFPFEVIKTRMQIQVSVREIDYATFFIQSLNIINVCTGTNGRPCQVWIQ